MNIVKSGAHVWEFGSLNFCQEMTVSEVTSLAELEKLKSEKSIALNFHADWCEPCPAMNEVFSTLATQHGAALTFVQVDADKGEELVDRFGVGAVPTYIVLKPDLSVATRVEGADAAKLTEAVRAVVADAPAAAAAANAPVVSIEDRLRSLINKAPVMLFMKGSPGNFFFF
jgi:thioredoxin-like negative regulator of GroEL